MTAQPATRAKGAAGGGGQGAWARRPMRLDLPAMRTTLPAALALLSACGATPTPPAQQPPVEGPSLVVTPDMGHPHVGDRAPDFTVSTPEGETLSLSSLRGRIVVLAFVTSWCPFSQAEQPQLARLAHEFAGHEDVRVVVVNVDEAEEGYRKYVASQDMGTPIYWSAAAEPVLSYVPPRAAPKITRERWRVLIASKLVIDRSGVIRFFTVLDTLHYDAELKHVSAVIAELLKAPT